MDAVYKNNLMTGSNYKFYPTKPITRSEFVKVLANYDNADLSAYKTSSFKDVANNKWYMPAVEWAAKLGIVNGTGQGRFSPERAITREELAVMLSNYFKYKEFTLPVTVPDGKFTDDAKISNWARDAVYTLKVAGILKGKTGGKFDPKATATRAETAQVFATVLSL